jgi:hypothetical protein
MMTKSKTIYLKHFLLPFSPLSAFSIAKMRNV